MRSHAWSIISNFFSHWVHIFLLCMCLTKSIYRIAFLQYILQFSKFSFSIKQVFEISPFKFRERESVTRLGRLLYGDMVTRERVHLVVKVALWRPSGLTRERLKPRLEGYFMYTKWSHIQPLHTMVVSRNKNGILIHKGRRETWTWVLEPLQWLETSMVCWGWTHDVLHFEGQSYQLAKEIYVRKEKNSKHILKWTFIISSLIEKHHDFDLANHIVAKLI